MKKTIEHYHDNTTTSNEIDGTQRKVRDVSGRFIPLLINLSDMHACRAKPQRTGQISC